MRYHQQPGYLLHQRDYSETSLLLEIFTHAHGRLGLIAKGARRPRNRVRGVLKPFQRLLLSWSGNSELAVLTGAEVDGADHALDGSALYCGFYLNELLLRLLHRHDPHGRLFEAYESALDRLQPDISNEPVLRIFEKNLLRELGYALVLDREIEGKAAIESGTVYEYILDRGPVRVEHPELNRPANGVRLRGASLLALDQEVLDDPAVRRDAKALMRAALSRHLGDRPLNTRKLYRRVVPATRLEQEID